MPKTLKDVTAVYRKYRCIECGEHHAHGVHVDIIEPGVNGDHQNGRPVAGRWLCDECGNESWVRDVSLAYADLKDCDF